MLKGPLTPGHKKTEVFGHFRHRPMPHSVVVIGDPHGEKGEATKVHGGSGDIKDPRAK